MHPTTDPAVNFRSLHAAYRKLFSSWQCGRRGWTRQDNKQGGDKVKRQWEGGGRDGGEYVSKITKRHSGQGDIYTHRVHINCYLQVQQSFKFPVE